MQRVVALSSDGVFLQCIARHGMAWHGMAMVCVACSCGQPFPIVDWVVVDVDTKQVRFVTADCERVNGTVNGQHR